MHLDARTARLLFWTGDRLLRFGALAASMILALLLLTHRQQDWRRQSLHRAWSLDGVYTDLAVAREIAAGRGYALDDPEGMPAQANTLWRVLAGSAARLTGDAATAAQGLSLFSALTLLVVIFRAVRSATSSSACAAAATLALSVSPPFLHLAGSPGPDALLALLVALAFDLHLRALHDDGRPLSAWTALAVGAATLLRPEAAALWLVFLIHAVADNLVERRGRERLELCAWNAVGGCLVIALCLWPLVDFNARHLGNPWPAAISRGDAIHMDGWRHLVADFPRATPWVFLVCLAGGVCLLALPTPRVGFRLAALPLAALLVPPACAVAGAFLEPGGPRLMVASLIPTLLAFGAGGLARAAAHARRQQPEPAAMAVGAVLLVAVGLHGALAGPRETAMRVQSLDQRQAAAKALGLPDASALRVATDQPGWVRFAYPEQVRVLDLTGRTSMTTLRCQGLTGEIDPTRVRAMLQNWETNALLLWNPQLEGLLDRLELIGWPRRWQPDAGWPRLRQH